MFLADLLDLREHKESKAGFKWREKSRFHGVSHRTAFPHCRFRCSTWNVDTKQCDLKGKEKDRLWESDWQWPTVWQLVFQVHSQPNILAFTVLLSYILRYWLLSFKFLLKIFFLKASFGNTYPLIKVIFKIVAQTLEKKKKREEKFELKEKKIKSNLWKGSG